LLRAYVLSFWRRADADGAEPRGDTSSSELASRKWENMGGPIATIRRPFDGVNGHAGQAAGDDYSWDLSCDGRREKSLHLRVVNHPDDDAAGDGADAVQWVSQNYLLGARAPPLPLTGKSD